MITVTFNCENHNHILLLTALYDILTIENIEDSIAAQDNTGWMIDEITARVIEIHEYDSDAENFQGRAAYALLDLAYERAQGKKPKDTKGNLLAHLDHAWTEEKIDTETIQAIRRDNGYGFDKMSADEFRELLRSNPGEPVLRNVGDKRMAQLRRYFLET